MSSSDVVRRNKQLIGSKLSGSIKINWISGFISGKSYYLFNFISQCSMDYIFSAINIRLNTLHRFVFSGGHLFHCSRMNHAIHPSHGLSQQRQIQHINDEVSHGLGIYVLLHLKLLKLITRKYDQPFRRKLFKNGADTTLTEGSSATSNQDGFPVNLCDLNRSLE